MYFLLRGPGEGNVIRDVRPSVSLLLLDFSML